MALQKKYIWTHHEEQDLYAEFSQCFSLNAYKKVILRITADYKFAAFVNSAFCANGQLADVPEYKTFSEHDVTAFVKKGENELRILAYHTAVGTFQCRVMTPCVCFEILADDEVIAVSSEQTLARKAPHYLPSVSVTPQLGVGYDYTFVDEAEAFAPATVVNPNFTEVPRPIRNCETSHEVDCEIVAQGVYRQAGGETSAEMMQNAWLKTIPLFDMTGHHVAEHPSYPLTFKAEGGDGIFLIGDLKMECAGYPYLSVEVTKQTNCYLGWGEHLDDLRVRTNVGPRHFASKITLQKGENDFTEYLRRMGCRYIALYFEDATEVIVKKFGLIEELYPLEKPEKDFGDRLLNQIYETSRRTLELCMHEHYEDCPWREQALYGMDSRNQMLFGYGAFREYEFPRASMALIARTIQADGLIPICSPSVNALTIPSFSAYWVIAVYDNVKVDYNEAFLKEVLPSVEKVIDAYKANTFNATVHTFPKNNHWNFHEWSHGLDGGLIFRDYEIVPLPDGLMTALAYKATKCTAFLEEKLGNTEKAKRFAEYADELEKGLQHFYDEEKGLFRSYLDDDNKLFHEYTQALFLATGALSQAQVDKMVAALTKGAEGLIPLTLAGLPVKYEALLSYTDSLDYVLDDISKIFGNMLYQGATSFWETDKGATDFENAGSLCHGWSAVACYVLDTYCAK